jgi:hypothetical protein
VWAAIYEVILVAANTNQLKPVNEAIRRIVADPLCREEKKGGLSGVRVHKFKVGDQQFLHAMS